MYILDSTLFLISDKITYMASNNIELEIKFALNNPDEVRGFLSANAEMTSENIRQKDSYFAPSHRDFLAVKYPFEWLRIRESGNETLITYKHQYPENVVEPDYTNEFETKIGSAEEMRSIFKSLDINELIVVEKVRTTWNYKNVEVMLDEVTDLGWFIEIEASTHFDDPKEGRKYLYEILKEVKANVGEEDFRGYPFMMLEKR